MVGDKIRKLRAGETPHKTISLGDGDTSVDISIVLLNIDDTQRIDEMVQEYAELNKTKVSESVRNQYYNRLLAYYCTRDPADPTYKTMAFDNIDEMTDLLDLEDISRITNAYGEVLMNKAPKLEMLSQEQFDLLKKHLEVTPLKDLSTVLLVHLVSCHRTIVSEI